MTPVTYYIIIGGIQISVTPLRAIVPAAGKGTRMHTDGCDLPKVMRLANGKLLLHCVLAATDFIAPGICILPLGNQIIGVNTPDQLAEVEAVLNERSSPPLSPRSVHEAETVKQSLHFNRTF